jgi:transposase
MAYRHYPPPAPLLVGYDPEVLLPPDHLARLVETVVEVTLGPSYKPRGPGQPPFDPRLLVKVLTYGYATGVRSSRQLERLCGESLPYLYLTRGAQPSYRVFCSARIALTDEIEAVWEALFAVAGSAGIHRVGRITIDSSKFWADASPESVLKQEEFSSVHDELRRILAEAAEQDARDDAEDRPGDMRTGKTVDREVMRDILRRVRRKRNAPRVASAEKVEDDAEPSAGHTPQMLDRIAQAAEAIEEAQAQGAKHLCLTDPDAQMMYGGRVRSTRESHSFEVAVDNGLLVAAQSTQEGHDNGRLEPLVEEAERHEPGGVTAVDADSGYFSGDAVARLLGRGLDLCIPDSHTACDLHRGQAAGTQLGLVTGNGTFTYEPAGDRYVCEAGQSLLFVQERPHGGATVRTYRADADCQACERSERCLVHKDAKHRTLKVSVNHEQLRNYLARFEEPAMQQRYRRRAERVETVFGFLRGTLGYSRWLLRGASRVAAEAGLFKLAYQMRKVHKVITCPAGC